MNETNIFRTKFLKKTMGENLRLTNDLDSIEIIEENIDLKKAQQICKKLLKHQDTIWCFQLRMCKIENM